MLWRREKKPVPLPAMNFRYLGLLANTSIGIELIYTGSVEMQMGIRKLWDTLKVVGEEAFESAFGLRTSCRD
jgi:hypothetical protein